MMRTVIGFQAVGPAVIVSLDRAPGDYDGDGAEVDLTSVSGGTLVDRGQAMLNVIAAQDPVKSGLAAALAQPAGSPPWPLYFHVRAAAADAIEWEQIYKTPYGFCALDARWPIGRIAKVVRTVKGRAFTTPLRVVAVLAAAGRDGRPQLEALVDAVQASPVPTELHVISGDEELVAAAHTADVTAELIAGTGPELCKQIGAARPHVLHLLCHGGSVAGVRALAFATIADVDAGVANFGSLRISTADLVDALNACDPWLVVLAACETAEAANVANGRAIAHELVSAGVTAVIGMRRIVDLHDTDRFCAALYPEVLTAVDDAAASAGDQPTGEAVLDWASALTSPRKVMSGSDPSAADAWLDPVLYVQNDELRVFRATAHLSPAEYAQLQGKRDKYLEFLSAVDPLTTDQGVIDDVRLLLTQTEMRLAEAGG